MLLLLLSVLFCPAFFQRHSFVPLHSRRRRRRRHHHHRRRRRLLVNRSALFRFTGTIMARQITHSKSGGGVFGNFLGDVR